MITFECATTNEALEFIADNLSRLGKLEKITHERISNEAIYKTTIKGDTNTMILEGGLSSGYSGEGPRGLYNLLIKLGIEEDTAKKEVYSNSGNMFSFEIQL